MRNDTRDETDPSQPTKCPIERKTNDDDANATTVVTMEYDAAVPELAPSGEFEARLVGKRTEAATRGGGVLREGDVKSERSVLRKEHYESS